MDFWEQIKSPGYALPYVSISFLLSCKERKCLAAAETRKVFKVLTYGLTFAQNVAEVLGTLSFPIPVDLSSNAG